MKCISRFGLAVASAVIFFGTELAIGDEQVVVPSTPADPNAPPVSSMCKVDHLEILRPKEAPKFLGIKVGGSIPSIEFRVGDKLDFIVRLACSRAGEVNFALEHIAESGRQKTVGALTRQDVRKRTFRMPFIAERGGRYLLRIALPDGEIRTTVNTMPTVWRGVGVVRRDHRQ